MFKKSNSKKMVTIVSCVKLRLTRFTLGTISEDMIYCMVVGVVRLPLAAIAKSKTIKINGYKPSA